MARVKSRKVFKGSTRDDAIKYIKYISGKINEISKKHSEMLGHNSTSIISEVERLGKKNSTKRAERIVTLGGLTRTNKDGRTVLSATKKLENLSDKDLLKYARGLSTIANRERYSSKKAFMNFMKTKVDERMSTLVRNTKNMTLEGLKALLGSDYYRFANDVFSGAGESGWDSDQAFAEELLSQYEDSLIDSFKAELNKRLENNKKERELLSRGMQVR